MFYDGLKLDPEILLISSTRHPTSVITDQEVTINTRASQYLSFIKNFGIEVINIRCVNSCLNTRVVSFNFMLSDDSSGVTLTLL